MSEPSDPAGEHEPIQTDSLDRVGHKLRQAYRDAANEPLPEAFEELLRKLR